MTRDPFEKGSIADQPENAELLKALQKKLSDWRTKQGDTVPVYLEKKYVAPRIRGFKVIEASIVSVGL